MKQYSLVSRTRQATIHNDNVPKHIDSDAQDVFQCFYTFVNIT